jgi:DNA-binding transcriptional ArsR family regulator
MGYTLVAPVGEDWRNLFIGIKDFPVEKMVLIVPEEQELLEIARDVGKDMERLHIPHEVITIRGEMFEGFFQIVNQLRQREGEDRLLLNVASGDKLSACIALSAAFVNGIKAFGVKDGKPMLFPVMKFSYYRLISDKKMRILRALIDGPLTLEKLGKAAGMSPPLLSYHLHGSRKTQGLLDLGLVEMDDGKVMRARLSTLGTMLLRAYI